MDNATTFLKVLVEVVILICVVLDTGLSANFHRLTRETNDPGADCALFTADERYVSENGSSYILLGNYDLGQDVDIQLDVFPDKLEHDGILLSMGSTDDFEYYEWKTKAVKTKFFVMELVYSAVSMLLKADGMPHMHPVEIYRTYPTPYTIADARWHTIRAQRFRNRGVWRLSLDNIQTEVPIHDKTNVILQHKHLFLGGRPGYSAFQFKGIIKNVSINGNQVVLGGKLTKGRAEVWHCSAPRVRDFIDYNKRMNQNTRTGRFGRPDRY